MVKETVICIIIVICIVSLDMYTQNFTKNTVSEMNTELDLLEDGIFKNNENVVKEYIDKLENLWHEKNNCMAYYIEHDELEKVSNAIVTMKSYWQNDDYSSAISKIEEGKFILNHIQEKMSFNLKNIL